ncbi:general transcription factor II-I repeat domain-containing protein 2B [Trichonephila clavata]|uniref:General transcription factor II-I repeat domain-containing protein 2B n=1 Tax=Trichonephila clavata TaxID=2740835 RepID=A0A8X6KES5_TRICU|nr:general transcription factor II-I repeat domain-containing protein 2B [Trichonephila clavata]
MTTENEKKTRKYEQENRSFSNESEENFFFIDNNGKAFCVICNSMIKNYKASNLRRHYETNHPQFSNQYPPNSKLRSDKLVSLKSNLNEQQSILTTFNNQANNVTAASFVIAWNIALAKSPLALDESTDITYLPQLAVSICFVSPDFVIEEELLNLVTLQESTRGIDIKNALDSIVKTFEVPFNKLVSIATDGIPAMLGKKIGLIGLLRDDSQISQFIPIHCIIHREHLVTKYLKYTDVRKTVLHIVNYIRTNEKNHRQFKNFLEELKDEELPNVTLIFFALLDGYLATTY